MLAHLAHDQSRQILAAARMQTAARGDHCFRFGDGPRVCGTPSQPVTECAGMLERNECCSSADCAEGRCFRTAEPGGACAHLALSCCRQAAPVVRREPEIACVYPSDGCQSDLDCSDAERCVVVNGRTACSATCS